MISVWHIHTQVVTLPSAGAKTPSCRASALGEEHPSLANAHEHQGKLMSLLASKRLKHGWILACNTGQGICCSAALELGCEPVDGLESAACPHCSLRARVPVHCHFWIHFALQRKVSAHQASSWASWCPWPSGLDHGNGMDAPAI